MVVRMTFIFALVAVGAHAQGAPKKRTLAERIEIPGTVVCIGCELEKGAGADAQCELYSKHAQGLRDAEGNLWTFLDNLRGHALVTQRRYRDREVKLLGWKYPKTMYVEVWKYQIKGDDQWFAYDFCKHCGWERGDNKDKDVCPSCER